MRMEAFNQLTPPQEAHPMEQLLDVLGNTVQFFYTCWDRIVLNGYIERLQRPENLIHFFHDVVGIQARPGLRFGDVRVDQPREALLAGRASGSPRLPINR